MSYEDWIERWQLRLLNEHLLEVYGDEEESDDEIFEEFSEEEL